MANDLPIADAGECKPVSIPEVGEGKLLAALGDGNRTLRIADRLLLPIATVRRKLRGLEAAGVVYRDTRLSAVNDIFWRPAPPAHPLTETGR